MKGKSYHFGLQIGATYKFIDNVAGYVGVRGLYSTSNYNGAVNPTVSTNVGKMPLNNYGIDLNCDQTGFGAAIILGVDWKINDKWNVSAKYECPTRLNLKNKSEIIVVEDLVKEKAADILSQFEDGKKVREDVPAMLALGAQYSPIEKVRLNAAYHQFFDKVSTKFLNKEELISHNTHEFLLGAEYDFCKLITVSASWEITRYGLDDAYMNDLSFNLSNYMFGGGVRVHATKKPTAFGQNRGMRPLGNRLKKRPIPRAISTRNVLAVTWSDGTVFSTSHTSTVMRLKNRLPS